MGIRISEMEEATTFGADDYVPIVTSGTNKKALGLKIKDFIAGFFVAKDDNSRLITSLGQTFTDCDAVMTSGMYYNNMGNVSNAPAGTMLSSNGGQLIVTQRASDVRVFQTLYVYVGSGNKTEIYVRAQKNATSFADWRHITAADGISFDNTGTGINASNTQAAIEDLNSNKVSTSAYAWKFLGQKTGSVAIDLPTTWTELIIQVHPTSNANLNTIHLYPMQTTSLVNAGLGSFGTSYAVGQVSRTQAKLSSCVWGGSDVTSTTITYYYYR